MTGYIKEKLGFEDVQNPQYIMIHTGPCNKKEVDAAIRVVLADIVTAEAKVKEMFKTIEGDYKNTTYTLNFATDIKGNSLKRSFLWVSNPEVGRMLLGGNPDGTPRVEQELDPSWTVPETPLEDAIEELKQKHAEEVAVMERGLKLQESSTSWAEMDDLDSGDAENRLEELKLSIDGKIKDLKDKYRPRTREVNLAPLFSLGFVEFTGDRLEEVKSVLIDDNRFEFTVEPQPPYRPRSDEDGKTLYSMWVPEWMDSKNGIDLLHSVFDKYNTDEDEYNLEIHGKHIKTTYPYIEIDPRRNRNREGYCSAVVRFSRKLDCYDAGYALVMSRLFMVQNPADKKEYPVTFGFYRKAELSVFDRFSAEKTGRSNRFPTEQKNSSRRGEYRGRNDHYMSAKDRETFGSGSSQSSSSASSRTAPSQISRPLYTVKNPVWSKPSDARH